MRNSKLLPMAGCLAMTALLAACSSNPTNGYYDSNGQFVPSNPVNRSAAIHAPNSAAMTESGPEYNETYENHQRVRVVEPYEREGYYDYNGYYLALDSGLNVPEDMFPSRGMCRVWFPHRPYSEEPPIESCQHIQERVPMGAYVIFGGE